MTKLGSALAVLACACHAPAHTAAPVRPNEATLQVRHTPEQIERGQYVAMIAGCTTCHTPMMPDGKLHDHSHELEGTELKVPGGPAIEVPNITPDEDTGIGKWSDAQIIASIRQGVRPDGARLAPVMPYPYYNRMTDADATALVAYLRTQPAIHHPVPRNTKLGMKPVDVAAPQGYVDRTDDPHAHGEYLASLMHCGSCHTPQQGPFANDVFAGGTQLGDIVAPNITSDRDTGIGSWSEDDVITAVTKMKDPEGHDLMPPMSEYAEAWSHLTGADAHALAVYVKSVPPIHHDLSSETHAHVSKR